MADPHSETGNGQPIRNKGEPPLADGQAPGSAKKALKPTDVFAQKKTSPDSDVEQEADLDAAEPADRFWQTDKFRTRASIGMICLLLGTFGIVCYQRYRNRPANGDTVVSAESVSDTGVNPDSDDEADDTTNNHKPEPLADLPNEIVEPTPIAKVENDIPSMSDDDSGKSLKESPPANENLSSAPDSLEENPFDSNPNDSNSPGQKVTATPVSKGKATDTFEDEFTGPNVSSAAPPPPVADPEGLTKLNDIESDEPATLGSGLEPIESGSPLPTPPQKSNPVSITEPEENDLDQRMAGFREVQIDSRQSAGKTTVVAPDPNSSDSNGPTARSVSDPNDGDQLQGDDQFAAPEPTRKDQRTIRTPEPAAATSILDDESAPLSSTPKQFDNEDLSAAPTEGEVYTVQPRDTYWRISKQNYGTVRYFLALARYNRDQVPDPKLMRPGIKIRIPSADLLEQQFPELLPKKSKGTAGKGESGPQFFMDSGTPKYRVGPKDNLSVISGRYLGDESRWDEIYQLNQELLRDANRLPVGTILSLPPEAASQRMAREPLEYR